MELEVVTKTERDTNLLTGEACVRVFYRYAGTRRWNKVVVFPSEGQTLEDIEASAELLGEQLLRQAVAA